MESTELYRPEREKPAAEIEEALMTPKRNVMKNVDGYPWDDRFHEAGIDQ